MNGPGAGASWARASGAEDLTTRASVSHATTIWREDGLEPAVVYLANLGVPLEVIHRVLIAQMKAKLIRQRDDAVNKK